MSQIATQHFSFSDLQLHPDQVIELLAQASTVAIIVKRDGDDITVSSYPTYSQEVHELLEEAKAEHQARKQHGYDRAQAFQGLRESLQKISKYL